MSDDGPTDRGVLSFPSIKKRCHNTRFGSKAALSTLHRRTRRGACTRAGIYHINVAGINEARSCLGKFVPGVNLSPFLLRENSAAALSAAVVVANTVIV